MKIKIDLDENLEEEEVIIRCRQIDKTVEQIQKSIWDISASSKRMSFFKDDSEYYLPLDHILFFETADNKVDAHTIDEVYKIKYRLYELEEILPHNFIRVSKSTILNMDKIYSISRSLATPNIVQFNKSHKQVYVSRLYMKELNKRLGERRNYYEI